MQKCTRCEIEKELSEFHRRSQRSRGYNTICKLCLNSRRNESVEKNREKFRKQANDFYYRNREKQLAKVKAWWSSLSEERKQQVRDKKKKRFHASPEQKRRKLHYTQNVYDKKKFKANKILNDAVRKGMFKPRECTVCKQEKKLDGHHNDYSKPLDVIWVCRKCHSDIHKKKE